MLYSNKIKAYLSNEIFIGSLIIITLTFLGNGFSYLFQFLSARLLGPEDYVIIAVITSLIAIFAIPSSAIQTVIAKNTTALKVKGDLGRVKGLMKSSLKKVLEISLIFFVLYLIASIYLSSLFKIDYKYLFLTGIFIFAAFLYPVMAGIAQGMKKFTDLGVNFLINCLIKFIVGVGLIFLGFKIYGAIIGFLAGIFLAFLLFFYSFRDLLKNKTQKYQITLFSRNNLFPLIAMILFVLIFNLDVIFAKILFGAEIAGKYSVASLIGKIILFIVSSICTVMLPVSSEKYLRGNDTRNVLKKTLGLALIVCIFGMLAFLLFPKLILSILFGSRYISIYNILFYVGAGFSFISLLNIFLINAIATNKVGIKTVAILSTCLGVLIALFLVASKSIEAFSMGFMISGFISAIGGYLIYKYENFSNNANV